MVANGEDTTHFVNFLGSIVAKTSGWCKPAGPLPCKVVVIQVLSSMALVSWSCLVTPYAFERPCHFLNKLQEQQSSSFYSCSQMQQYLFQKYLREQQSSSFYSCPQMQQYLSAYLGDDLPERAVEAIASTPGGLAAVSSPRSNISSQKVSFLLLFIARSDFLTTWAI
jgi:hypothetical protein